MITSITDGIAVALFNEFGGEYDIYTENIEQGLKEPCFYISCVSPTNDLFFNKRYKRTNLFNVQFFPYSKSKNKECAETTERLFETLEVITVGGRLVRGTKMTSEVVDGILHFNVHYDLFTIKDVQQEHMEEYKLKTNSKKGARNE